MSDRIDRLKALTGQEEVYDNYNMEETQAEGEDAFVLPEGFTITAHHVYEGTSEEDNTPPRQASKPKKSRKGSNAREQQWKEDAEEDGADNLTARMRAGMNQNQYGSSAPLLYPELGSNDFPEYKALEYGQLAAEGERFCSWKTVTQYPYQYVGNGNRPKVTERFFNNGKCYFQTWDFFYLYRLKEESNQSPIFLVPTKQVEYFLAVINRSLGINLTIPSGSKGAFEAVFNNDGTPYPRYLGRALNKNMADELRENVPPRYYKLDGEPPITEPPVDTSFEAFRAKIAAMNLTAKNKKAQNKERQKVERFAKQRSWRGSTKRVQRYLGLRKRSENDTDHTSSDENTFYDPEELTKFMMEDAVVFICIDVEAYELNNNIVTEIGIATLDVLDIANMKPGALGKNWRKAIRARHFRIKEHMHLNNTKHVHGCAESFEFGTSEVISIDDAPHVVGTCFKYPFSDPSPSAELADKKRNIILVGHDVDADIRFLRHIGYEINNLNLHECCDTTLMWRALHREQNPTKLSNILEEIGVAAWNLHNAGNDAVYTLQAMLGIACKHLVDRKIERKEKDKLKKNRISEAVKEAAEMAYEREEGWSSDGSDGGDRITPKQANAKKAADAAKKAASKRKKVTDVNELWRDGSKPVTATSSTSWAGIPQGSNQASQVGWGTPPATPTRNRNINTGSAPRPQPALIPAEKFGYSSEYKSPAIKLNSSTSTKTSFKSAADIKANFREQLMTNKRIDGDRSQDWATRNTKAVFISTPTGQVSTSMPVPINRASASTSANNTDINITGLEQQMQNTTLAGLQEQGRIPGDLSAKAPKGNRRVKW
ncbi:d7b7b35d-8a93-49ab-8a4f-0ef94b5017f3 [Sclerotinia trifoliorum]|uniref:D7b7b35d-8a93-49ab-8a4f-0ef94b5017f3 n=1 Tax=Sclerotinia trifoliorum TaxID=28548 RepID=A0A8H2ZM08_9HELO|nr:d7b7b35d-8a93-49ab-8a4f-0ef94b5017f3 [Sclerotinia trifoliorum]